MTLYVFCTTNVRWACNDCTSVLNAKQYVQRMYPSQCDERQHKANEWYEQKMLQQRCFTVLWLCLIRLTSNQVGRTVRQAGSQLASESKKGMFVDLQYQSCVQQVHLSPGPCARIFTIFISCCQQSNSNYSGSNTAEHHGDERFLAIVDRTIKITQK